MSQQSISNLWMFAVYGVYVLLPLVPTIIIYRMFPDTEVSLGGMIHGLQLNTTGAFAAYVVTLLLGTWIAKGTVADIGTYEKSMWTVSADVKLRDDSGHLINDPTDLAGLTVDLVPSISQILDKEDDHDPNHPIHFKYVEVKVPVVGSEWPSLKFTVPHWEPYTAPIATAQLDQENHLAKIAPFWLVKTESQYEPTKATPITKTAGVQQYPNPFAPK
jgi:hypothetical protein